MNILTDWIKRHQVASFFILAYLITWPLLILGFFVFPGNQVVMALCAMPVVFSPALAAMLISSIVEPQPKALSCKPRWIAFGVSWLIAWTLITLYYWQVEMLKLVVAVILSAFFAMFPAWVLSSAFARTPGIRKHFSTLIRPKGKLLWYLLAFVTVPALALLGAEITRLVGGEIYFRLQGMSLGQMVVFFAFTFFYGFLCTGGINEESGWRGFALPRLQARYPVIVSVAIVWFFWALWHIPYDLGQQVDLKWMLVNRTLFTFIFSVLFAWVYNRTKGSILAPALFHPSMNAFGNNLPFTPASVGLYAALAIFAIVSDRMWKKLPPDDPAVFPLHQQAAQPGEEAALVPAH